jgi:hypothetical protein
MKKPKQQKQKKKSKLYKWNTFDSKPGIYSCPHLLTVFNIRIITNENPKILTPFYLENFISVY